MSESAQALRKALEAAIHKRDVAAVRDLVRSASGAGQRGAENALALAIYGEPSSVPEQREAQRQVVGLLLAHGADADSVDSRGKSVLYYAVEIGDLELARLVLRKGAGVDRSWRMTKDTPLMKAADTGDIALVQLLLEHGADPAKANMLGTTALDRAASRGHTEVALLLMRAKAPGPRALWNAAGGGNSSMLLALLQSGAEVDAVDGYGWTALMRACSGGHAAAARMLLDSGARVDVADRKTGLTPLMLACDKDSTELVQLLLERKAAIDAADAQGRSILVRSVANAVNGKASNEILRLLLDAGANIEAPDSDSLTPLMMAAVAGKASLLALLIDKGAAIDAKDRCGVPAVEQAAIYGHTEAVAVLIGAGARRVPLAQPVCKPQDCPICAGLPERATADKVRGEEMPPAHKRLLWPAQAHPVCPYCATRYVFSNEYEFGIPSIDVDTLERLK